MHGPNLDGGAEVAILHSQESAREYKVYQLKGAPATGTAMKRSLSKCQHRLARAALILKECYTTRFKMYSAFWRRCA